MLDECCQTIKVFGRGHFLPLKLFFFFFSPPLSFYTNRFFVGLNRTVCCVAPATDRRSWRQQTSSHLLLLSGQVDFYFSYWLKGWKLQSWNKTKNSRTSLFALASTLTLDTHGINSQGRSRCAGDLQFPSSHNQRVQAALRGPMHRSLTVARGLSSCPGCQAMLHHSAVLGPWNTGTGQGSLAQKRWQQAIHKSDRSTVRIVLAAVPELVMTIVMSWWLGRVVVAPAVLSGSDWGRGCIAFVLKKAPWQGSEPAGGWTGLIAAVLMAAAPPGTKVAFDLTLGMNFQLFASG